MFRPGRKMFLTAGKEVTASHVEILGSKLKSILKKRYQNPPGGETEHPFYIHCDLQYQACESCEVNQHEYILIGPGGRARGLCSSVYTEVDENFKIMLTKGVSGIGKTSQVRMIILNWAEGKGNQEVQLIFPLSFRELNLVKEKLSLIELLYKFFPELKEHGISDLESSRVGFVFDGLDEFRRTLDFKNSPKMTNITEAFSVPTLLTNLIIGNILPSAQIWITSRPAAVSRIPCKYIHEVAEIEGFTDVQKEEFFRRAIRDKNQAEAVITYLKASKGLYDLCRIPFICSLVASVLEKQTNIDDKICEPVSFSPFFNDLLVLLKSEVNNGIIVDELGELALKQLMNSNTVFYEEDLRECKFDLKLAANYAKLKIPIFREDVGLDQKKIYYFGHTTIQEFFAAFYYVFRSNDPLSKICAVDRKNHVDRWLLMLQDATQLKCAVDMTLRSKTGHLDLFLRFVLGSLQVLHNVISETGLIPSTALPEMSEYIKEKIMENPTSPRTLNLLNCLRELEDDSLENKIGRFLKTGISPDVKYPNACWSDLAALLVAEYGSYEMPGLEVGKRGDMELLKRLPVVKACTKAILRYHNLTEKSCEVLSSALTSRVSILKALDLSFNTLKDTGVQLLAAGLSKPHCRLGRLKLSGCRVKEKGFAALGKALQSNPSHLRELDLSFNEPGESGVFHLVEGLKVVKCKLQVLKLSNCQLGLEQCQALVGFLKDNPQHLRDLDVSINNVGDEGVNLLMDGLKCTKIHKLELYCCQLTEKCCEHVSSCLVDLPSLRELNLSNNNLKDEGVQMLCNTFGLPANLDKLNLGSCGFSEGCDLLAKFFIFDSMSLKVLDISRNHFGDEDVITFFLFIQTFSLSLETLRLSDCKLTDDCCLELVEALCSSFPNLKELDLSENKLGDSGVKILCRALISPTCKLETLFLGCCGITSVGCSSLALALKSNQCNITELSLVRNDTGEEGLRILSAIRDDPRYKLLNLEIND
ncbi:hypothetical protein UPYG_G00065340 [Umbra pygmaea]|uniref:NACHT domain-containing protein n=1 Tax=Umbra pygmaea TaxID=75934 RepID=A0ABD0XS37_UMBPY